MFFNNPYSGFVYFIADKTNMKVKIGYSKNPEKRLKTLQTANPNELTIIKKVPGDQKVERAYQKHFCHSKINLEWFYLTPDIIEFCNR